MWINANYEPKYFRYFESLHTSKISDINLIWLQKG